MLALALFLARAPLTWLVAGLGGTVLFLAIAVQPAVGLAVLGLSIPFGGLFSLPWGNVGVVDVLVGLTLAAWLARSVARREIAFRWPAMTWPVLLLVWTFALSLTQAVSWREGLPEWLKWAEFAALYLGAAQILTRWRHVAWMLAGLLAAGLIEVGIGAYQFLRQVGPEQFILMGRFMRAYGTFNQPNPYAGYLGYLAPVAASLAAYGAWRWWQGRRACDLVLAVVCALITIALAGGIGMSASRGAWLGLGASLLVVVAVLALRNRRTAAVLGGIAAVLVLAAALLGTGRMVPAAVSARLSDLFSIGATTDPARTEITDENFAVLERLAHWQAGQRMFADHPWLGVGIGNYAVAYPAYALPHWYEPLGHAHNVYINFLAETGVVGTAAFALFWLGIILAAWKAGRRAGGYRAALAVGILGTLTYCTVHNVFDNLFVAHMQLQLAMLLAAIGAETARL